MDSRTKLFHCDVCSSDCTNRIRIQCAICTDYDLCVPCFAAGLTTGDHKPWHDYQIIEQNTYPIFDRDWGADEELLLIQGCETSGLGSGLILLIILVIDPKKKLLNIISKYI